MPEVDCFQVIDALQNNGSKIPVIVLTADIQESVRQRCLELGAFELIYKPLKEENLCKVFNDIHGL